jgi:hypothetical protein
MGEEHAYAHAAHCCVYANSKGYNKRVLKQYSVGGYRIPFSALSLVAIGVELDRTIRLHDGIVDFFSFFTFESSLFAAAIFLLGGISVLRGPTVSRLAVWRGAATVYMTITGIVYTILLRGPDPTAVPWANDLLHYIFPIIFLADWFIDTPRLRITFKQGLIWVIYPLVYLAYTLMRGAYTHWYPYPFIDPITQGYAGVIRMSLIILVGALVLIGILTLATRRNAKIDTQSP